MTVAFIFRWLTALAGSAVVSFVAAQLALGQTSPEEPARSVVAPPPAASEADADVARQPDNQSDATDDAEPSATADQRQTAGEAQALEQGPIHEAFAEPLSNKLEDGLTVDREPPESVEEIPPAFKPEGDNVEWIPGYWMWTDDQKDFIWVSGLWRAIPPGRMWTPGHWGQAGEKYVWVSGFWSDVNDRQVEYLPYPPESLEQGPTTQSPSDNDFWVPGCWTWEDNRYAWSPGYWYAGQQNWVWVPNHYSYTPRGAVYVRGYWDYPIQQRGLLYAPVYWQGGYQTGYRYTPNNAVNTALLLSSLFIDRDRGNYYYGRGYGGRSGYLPWYSGYGRGNAYSPLYGYYSWQYGRDSSDWSDRFDRDRYGQYRDRNRDRDRNDRFGDRDYDREMRRNAPLVATVDELRRSFDGDNNSNRDSNRDNNRDANGDRRSTFLRMQELSDDDRQSARNRAEQMQRYRAARANFEAQPGEGALHAQLERSGDNDNANGNRRARLEMPEGYRPPTFNLESDDAGQALRRGAMERNQRYEQQRSEAQRRAEDRGGQNGDLQNRRPQNQGPQNQRPQNQGQQIRSDTDRAVRGGDPNRARLERSNQPGRNEGNFNRGQQDGRNFNRGQFAPEAPRSIQNREQPQRRAPEANTNRGNSNRGSENANSGGNSNRGSANANSGGNSNRGSANANSGGNSNRGNQGQGNQGRGNRDQGGGGKDKKK